jgi:N-acetylglutamate synthase-like GNAT family acetyltransferase
LNAGYTISTDKARLDIAAVHQFLSEKSYWAQGRPLDTVRTSVENSLCFGVYDPAGRFAGFARVVTDYATVASIMDVFILDEHRGRGLGKALIGAIVNSPELKNVKRWRLATNDAHGLYRKFGFETLANPDLHMERTCE